MAARPSYQRGPSPLKLFAVASIVLVLGVTGTVGGLWAAGLVDLPFLRDREPSHAGQVKVILSARNIPAYKLIRREDLIDPATGTWLETWANEKDVAAARIVADPTKLIGRVMTHDKGTLLSFTEDDFMPVGTRPGIVAGIPAGKRSLALPAGKLEGIHGLQMGDRFDIVSTLAADKRSNNNLRNVRGLDGLPPPEPRVRVLVDNGAIVSPVHMREEVSTSNSLTKGSRTNIKPVEEVVIALDPEEIPKLTAAISQNASILVVARSGRPDDAAIQSITPESPAPPPPTIIETVIGEKRETLVFPQLPAEEDSAPEPQPSKPFPLLPRSQPRHLPVRESVDVAKETMPATFDSGARP